VSTLVLEPIGGIAGDMTIARAPAPRSAPCGARGRPAPPRAVGVSVEAREVEVQGIRALHVECARGPGPPCPPAVARHPGPDLAVASSTARGGAGAVRIRAPGQAEARIHGVDPETSNSMRWARSTRSGRDRAALLLDALAPERIVSLLRPRVAAWSRAPTARSDPLAGHAGAAAGANGPAQRAGRTDHADGAAILLPGPRKPWPSRSSPSDRIGYGAGTRRWEDAPNLLRAVLGRPPAARDREGSWILEPTLTTSRRSSWPSRSSPSSPPGRWMPGWRPSP